FSLMSVTSDKSGWKFITIMPTEQFFNRVTKLKTLVFTVIAAVLIIGILTSVYMAMRQYRPLKDLVNELKKNTAVSLKNTHKGNELERIKDTIDSVYSRQTELMMEKEDNK